MSVPATPLELVPGLRWRRVFPGEVRQLSALRGWLATLLPESPARDDLATVATELASNTIRHTASGRGGWFSVEVTWQEPMLRVAVADSGGPTEPEVIEDPAGEHGRGLLLVQGLSARTGVCGDHRGRLVWADVRWDGGVPAADAAGDPYEMVIREGEAALAHRFAGALTWFGRATLRWWALPASGGLVSAPSAGELAELLSKLAVARRAEQPGARGEHDQRTGGDAWRPGSVPASARARPGGRGSRRSPHALPSAATGGHPHPALVPASFTTGAA